MNTYEVWRTPRVRFAHIGDPIEIKTNHTIRARTQKEAEYKLGQRFKNAGFHRMILFVRNIGREEG